jgi:hypothetical protein
MKFPRTFHLPNSPGFTDDDKILKNLDHLLGKNVIITEKLDGENTSFHRTGGIHARSINHRAHPSQSIVSQIHGSIAHLIPENLQIVGENVYATHSIYYDRLTSYFYVIAIIDKSLNVFLSVEDTLKICKELGLKYVPILYQGVFDGKFTCPKSSNYGDTVEGFVVRVAESFSVNDFSTKAAKWVRANHVTTNDSWRNNWKPNKLLIIND